jgi:SHS2 domain-containing protein
MIRYEEIPHTADIALRVYGRDLKELFVNAAYGMFDIIADLEGLKSSVSVDVDLKASSREGLLVSWLDELLYDFYTKGIIFFRFEILVITAEGLIAKAHGRHVGENRNRLKREIKAATFHNLEIKETPDGLSVDIVFDV